MFGRSSGAFEKSWFREAVTEHTNTVLRSGHPEIFNPDNEYRDGTYEGWRMIVNVILEKGDEKINPKLITRAMSGSQSEKNVFYEAVDKSWGVDDCLGLISRFIDIKTRDFTKGFYNINYFNQVESVSYDTYDALTNTPELIFGYSEKTWR